MTTKGKALLKRVFSAFFIMLSLFIILLGIAHADEFTGTAVGNAFNAVIIAEPMQNMSGGFYYKSVPTYIYKNYSSVEAQKHQDNIQIVTVLFAVGIGMTFMLGFLKGRRT